jgi:ribosomal protein L19
MASLNSYVIDRNHRLKVWSFEFDKLFWFTRGDSITFSYKGKGYGFSFTGICLSIRKRWLHDIGSSFLVRNLIGQVIIESSVSLYAAIQLRLWVLDHARKQFKYRPAKLYYLRNKPNQASRVIVA